MTTTTEAPATEGVTTQTTPLPTTTEGWRDLWYADFEDWGTNIRNEAAEFLLAQTAAGITTMPDRDPLLRAWRAAVPSYFSSQDEDTRVYDWIKAQVDEATIGSAQPTPREVGDAETLVEIIFPTGPTDYLAEQGVNTERIKQYRTVLAYQFTNWKAGRYTVSSDREALRQMNRRLSREYGRTITSGRDERLMLSALGQLRQAAADPSFEPMPPAPTHDQLEAMLRGKGYFAGNESNGVYYLANHLTTQATRARQSGYDPVTMAETAVADAITNMKNYVSWSEGFDEDVESALGEVLHLVYPVPGPVSEVDGSINDVDTLMAWQMSLHPKVSEFQATAIKNGILDFTDQARSNGWPEGTNLVSNLRRMVGQYGFMKYTGKERRPSFEGHLRTVVAAIKDQPLTEAEWLARWARRDIAVSYVAGRYGEQNSMCPVLERATAELGVDPMRKPKHKVRFEGSGVLVEVEVETWHDEGSTLRDHAKAAWSKMTDKQKEAAIVEVIKPYVNWADMRAAR